MLELSGQKEIAKCSARGLGQITLRAKRLFLV